MRKGDRIELEIEKFADQGKSLARQDGYVIFVPGAVPGDRIRARIKKAKKSFAEGDLEEVLRPSPLRTQPRCFYFGTCGGCKWQHVDYQAQLEAKAGSVRDALVHTGGFRDVEVNAAIGSDRDYFYRNKMEFSFSASRWLTVEEISTGMQFDKDFALGLHVPGNFEKVLDIKECHLQSELSIRIVNGIRDFVKSQEWEPWDTRRQQGFARHLVIRTAERTSEVMLNLVTNGFDGERMEALARFIRSDFPEVTTFVNTINTSLAQTAFGEEIRTIFGPGVIHDQIGRFTFEIAPNAFFQTNTAQAERLYEVAMDYAALRSDDLVYDLYCGAGTITLYIADAVLHVIGIELVEEAVANAVANAASNGISNCTFVAGDMLKLFSREFMEEHGRPDVLIADPPRAGMHPRVVERVAEIGPERFVYVSCNPQTQARDLKLLGDTYAIEAVQPVDLFPQTHHVESVVKLRRR